MTDLSNMVSQLTGVVMVVFGLAGNVLIVTVMLKLIRRAFAGEPLFQSSDSSSSRRGGSRRGGSRRGGSSRGGSRSARKRRERIDKAWDEGRMDPKDKDYYNDAPY